jgi:hypothetical protein
MNDFASGMPVASGKRWASTRLDDSGPISATVEWKLQFPQRRRGRGLAETAT